MAMLLNARNRTLTALQSLSPPVVSFPSPSRRPIPHECTTLALPQVSVSEPVKAPPTGTVENVMHKYDLIRCCHKLGIPLPVYQTEPEGFDHPQRFRSTVCVGQRSFTSQNTFTNKKSAERDAAKLALDHLPTEDEAWSTCDREYLRKLVCQDKSHCKMIIHEFTVKMKIECKYKTVPVEATPPLFTSSLLLNSACYKGEGGKKNKKEAEQLAALVAICSLLDDPRYSTTISKIIMPKMNLGGSFFGCNKKMEEQRRVSETTEKQDGGGVETGNGVGHGLRTGVATVSRFSYSVIPIASSLLLLEPQHGMDLPEVGEFVSLGAPDWAYDSNSSKRQRRN